jgi:hypothetical protein
MDSGRCEWRRSRVSGRSQAAGSQGRSTFLNGTRRQYDWAGVTITEPGAGRRYLLIRRNRRTGELAFCRCYAPHPVTLAAWSRSPGGSASTRSHDRRTSKRPTVSPVRPRLRAHRWRLRSAVEAAVPLGSL